MCIQKLYCFAYPICFLTMRNGCSTLQSDFLISPILHDGCMYYIYLISSENFVFSLMRYLAISSSIHSFSSDLYGSLTNQLINFLICDLNDQFSDEFTLMLLKSFTVCRASTSPIKYLKIKISAKLNGMIS